MNEIVHIEELGFEFLKFDRTSGPMGMGLVPGFSLHDELRIMIENGFTPYEAIKTATVNAAHVIQEMKGKGDFGTLEVMIGKRFSGKSWMPLIRPQQYVEKKFQQGQLRISVMAALCKNS